MYILAVKDERGALVSEHRLTEHVLYFGRTPENDIVLASTAVSRQHACIYVESERIFVGDMRSANGVFVNGRRIHGEIEVNLDDQLRMGEFFIEIEVLRDVRTDAGINTAQVEPNNAHGKLLVLSGAQAGREVLLFEPIVTIGRIEENDVHLPDISVSRHHARLQYQQTGDYILVDLGSSNGTHLQGMRVEKPVRVGVGDRVHFGNIECLVASTTGPTKPKPEGRRMVIYALLALAAATIGIVLGMATGD